jgi:uncharacterized protein (DUF433 family)
MAAELTINEVAHIAEVPPRSVEKAIETGIIKPVKRLEMLSNARTRFLNLDAICYLAVIGHLRFFKEIPVSRKKILMSAIQGMDFTNLVPIDLESGLRLDLPRIAGTKLENARAYIVNRKHHITSDPEIFGGVPIIKGTRIPVYAVAGRLADGDTMDDLVDDYPTIPREAFIAADIYAWTHPERGCPGAGGRPWKTAG